MDDFGGNARYFDDTMREFRLERISVLLGDDGSTPLSSTPLQAKMGVFHFILPDSSAA